MGHFGQKTWTAGWLQGNRFGLHVPRKCERPKNQGQQRSHWSWWEESRSRNEFSEDSLLDQGKA